MARSNDYYSLIYGKVFDTLAASARVTSIIQPANMVDPSQAEFDKYRESLGPGDAPELVVMQGQFAQEGFTTGDVGVKRSQAFNLVVTNNSLSLSHTNQAKEAILDTLIELGPFLGLAAPVNGNKVTGWSAAGADSMTPDTPGPGQEGQEIFRQQALMIVTVNWLKALPRRITG